MRKYNPYICLYGLYVTWYPPRRHALYPDSFREAEEGRWVVVGCGEGVNVKGG